MSIRFQVDLQREKQALCHVEEQETQEGSPDLVSSPQRGAGWGAQAVDMGACVTYEAGLSRDLLEFRLGSHITRDIKNAKIALQNPLASPCGTFLGMSQASNRHRISR